MSDLCTYLTVLLYKKFVFFSENKGKRYIFDTFILIRIRNPNLDLDPATEMDTDPSGFGPGPQPLFLVYKIIVAPHLEVL